MWAWEKTPLNHCWSLWSAVFCKRKKRKPFSGFVVNQILPTAQDAGFVLFLFLSGAGGGEVLCCPTSGYFVLHLSALFIFWVCVVFLITRPGSLPSLSNIRNANGWWGWGLCFVAKREQMLSEMLWWFPPQIRLPIPAAPPAVNTALSNPRTAWDCLSSSSCLCLWGRHYSSTGMLKAQVKGLLFHIRDRGSVIIF